MKLYTQEQVLKMLNMSDDFINGDLYTYEQIIKSQIPIEVSSIQNINNFDISLEELINNKHTNNTK